MLCINFDDSRYRDVCDRILELCHPDSFVTNVLMQPSMSRPPEDRPAPEKFRNSADAVAVDAINRELEKFNPELAKAPQIVAGNKIDMAEPEQIERLKAYVEAKGYDYYSICAPIQEGTRELMNAVWNRLQTLPPVKEYEPEEIPTELLVQNSTGFTITNPEPGYYLVEAPWFPKVLKGIDVEDYEALQYMQRVLEKSGVFEALRQTGFENLKLAGPFPQV